MSATVHQLLDKETASADDLGDFSVFYRRYWPRLVRLIQRRTGDAELAQDIAQETLTRALDNVDVLDTSSSMWPWLKTVALRLVIEHARRREREVLVDDHEGGTTFTPPDERADFDSMISSLPRRQRVAISLKYVEGWRSSEAAAFLGMNRLAFDQLLTRARRSLKVQYRRMIREAFVLFPFVRPLAHRLRTLIASRRPRWERAESALQIAPGATSQVLVAAVATLIAAGPAAAPPDPAAPRHRMDQLAQGRIGRRAPVTLSQRRASSPTFGASPASVTQIEPRAPDESDRGGRAPHPSNERPAPLQDRAVEDVTEPNRGVTEPEDAQIFSLAFVPDGPREGETVFAAGTTLCRVQPCPPVLFRSGDAGRTWSRIAAEGLRGTQLAIPRGFGSGHETIFAMGPSGLQVSMDGGRTFELAAVSGASFATGSIALSPSFDEGDPIVLIGAQTLISYNDETRTSRPYPASTLNGPFTPAFSPDFAHDRRIVLGGQRIGAHGAGSAVIVCKGPVCEATPLNGEKGTPTVRLASDFGASGHAYAFTPDTLQASHDGARSFRAVPTGWDGRLDDVAIASDGTLVAAVASEEGAPGGLFVTRDEGHQWSKVGGDYADEGVVDIAISGDVFIASLQGGGLLCSSNGGQHWSSRCS